MVTVRNTWLGPPSTESDPTRTRAPRVSTRPKFATKTWPLGSSTATACGIPPMRYWSVKEGSPIAALPSTAPLRASRVTARPFVVVAVPLK